MISKIWRRGKDLKEQATEVCIRILVAESGSELAVIVRPGCTRHASVRGELFLAVA
jgi:hypothetical protein